jgi:hypothetical protein
MVSVLTVYNTSEPFDHQSVTFNASSVDVNGRRATDAGQEIRVGVRARSREDVSLEPAGHGRQSLGDPSVAAALRVILLGNARLL